jgi:hypothetical protein
LRQFGAAQPQARAVLKALVTAEGAKRALFVEELVARVQTTGVALTAEVIERDILRRLMQARLVRVEDVVGQPRYELAHEFLVSTIGDWIAESERELTKVLELIDRAYEAYQATGLLLEPGVIALIAPVADELVLPTDKQRFLDLSRQTARRQRRGLCRYGTWPSKPVALPRSLRWCSAKLPGASRQGVCFRRRRTRRPVRHGPRRDEGAQGKRRAAMRKRIPQCWKKPV